LFPLARTAQQPAADRIEIEKPPPGLKPNVMKADLCAPFEYAQGRPPKRRSSTVAHAFVSSKNWKTTSLQKNGWAQL